MSGLENVFPGKWLFAFVRRLYRNNNVLWTDIVCACHLVQCLEYPEQGIFLFHSKEPSILDSVSAWSVSNRFSDVMWQLPIRKDLMIRAMRVYMHKDSTVYEWFGYFDLCVVRSQKEWTEFTSECIRNCHFTIRWWKNQVIEPNMRNMKEAIYVMAREESLRLKSALSRLEKRRIVDAKMAKRSLKQQKLPPIKLTFADQQAIEYETETQYSKHQAILAEVEVTFNENVSVTTFDLKFPRLARILMGIARQYPKMRWSLKQRFHFAAEDRLALDTWFIERELCRQQPFEDPDPICALRAMCN